MHQVIQKQSSSPASLVLEEVANAEPSKNDLKAKVNGQAKTVALLLPGGVDSSVGLRLLVCTNC